MVLTQETFADAIPVEQRILPSRDLHLASALTDYA